VKTEGRFFLWGEKHRPLPPLRYGFPLQRGRKIEKHEFLIFNGFPPLEGEREAQGAVLFAGQKEGGFYVVGD
jgi:hypothetical protein